MARSKKKKKKKKSNQPSQKKPAKQLSSEVPKEEKSLEAATIGWCVSGMILLLLDVALVVGDYYFDFVKKEEIAAVTYGLLLYAGVVISIVSTILSLIVFKLRKVKPPSSLGVFVGILQAVPWFIILLKKLA